jgi:hypothetical protein
VTIGCGVNQRRASALCAGECVRVAIINQSTNQPINQSTNQPTSQSINQPIISWIDAINQSSNGNARILKKTQRRRGAPQLNAPPLQQTQKPEIARSPQRRHSRRQGVKLQKP